MMHNVLAGAGELPAAFREGRQNVRVGRSEFVDPDQFDYRLKSGSAAIGRGAQLAAAPRAMATLGQHLQETVGQ
jgi:hypothetical protein